MAKKKEKKMSGKEKLELKMSKKALNKSKQMDQEKNIDEILDEFELQQQAEKTIVQIPCQQPSPRVNCTFAANPKKNNEMLLFGGEFFDGKNSYVYNDLFLFKVDKAEWIQIKCPHSPKPRCSHQCVIYKNHLFMFGGEFSSPSGSQFKHYKDFWALDLTTYQWEEINASSSASSVAGAPSGLAKPPSARSGHRMVLWKNQIVLFGGFFDSHQEPRYFNDIYFFNLEEYRWNTVKYSTTAQVPHPRSGSQICAFEDFIYLFGGYSRSGEKGIVHNDVWRFHMINMKWEKVKCIGVSPSPRTSFSMVNITTKKRAILFGGVYDNDFDDVLQSNFFRDMYCFHFEGHRWFPVNFNQPPELLPCPRMNSQLSLFNNSKVFLYGGIVENEEKEWILNDIWIMDLSKQYQWACLVGSSNYAWQGEEESSSSSDSETSDSGMEDVEENEITDPTEKENPLRPLHAETLKSYFVRTYDHWAELALKEIPPPSPLTDDMMVDDVPSQTHDTNHSKQLRKYAFELATDYFHT